MTTCIASDPPQRAVTSTDSGHRNATSRITAGISFTRSETPLGSPGGHRGWGNAAEAEYPAVPTEVIGRAVTKAARRALGLTRRQLARAAGVTPTTVGAWEKGTIPLYSVRYDQLRLLGHALGLSASEPDPLTLAGQCDLLIEGMLLGVEDFAEVPPIDDELAGRAARGLLRWAFRGQPPEQYRLYVRPWPLVASGDAIRFAAIARNLHSGTHGSDLVSYGTALLDLARQ